MSLSHCYYLLSFLLSSLLVIHATFHSIPISSLNSPSSSSSSSSSTLSSLQSSVLLSTLPSPPFSFAIPSLKHLDAPEPDVFLHNGTYYLVHTVGSGAGNTYITFIHNIITQL